MLEYAEACLHGPAHIDGGCPQTAQEVCARHGGLVRGEADVEMRREIVIRAVCALVVSVAILHAKLQTRGHLAAEQCAVVGKIACADAQGEANGNGLIVVVEVM